MFYFNCDRSFIRSLSDLCSFMRLSLALRFDEKAAITSKIKHAIKRTIKLKTFLLLELQQAKSFMFYCKFYCKFYFTCNRSLSLVAVSQMDPLYSSAH